MKRTDNMQRGEPTGSGAVLYVTIAAALGLLWWERRSAMTPADHTIALLGIVLAVFAVTLMWLGHEGGL